MRVSIELPNGCKVEAEGTPKQCADLVRRVGEMKAEAPPVSIPTPFLVPYHEPLRPWWESEPSRSFDFDGTGAPINGLSTTTITFDNPVRGDGRAMERLRAHATKEPS